MIVSSLLDTVNPRISAESQLNAGSSDKRRVSNKRRVTGGYDYDGMYRNFWIDYEQTSGCF